MSDAQKAKARQTQHKRAVWSVYQDGNRVAGPMKRDAAMKFAKDRGGKVDVDPEVETGTRTRRVQKAMPIEVVDNRFWKERALWWKKTRTLIVAEAIGASRMFNPCAAGAGTHIGLRAAPPRKQLGTYNPKHLLMGHGDPISGKQATVALQEALDRSRRDLPGNLLKIPFAFR